MNPTFGSEMRRARKRRGLSQRALAKSLDCGCSHVWLGKMERGEVLPSRKWAVTLEKALGLEPGSLVWPARVEVGKRAMKAWDAEAAP